MKNVIIRSLTGLVYIGLIIGALLGGNIWMLGLTLLLTILAVDEFNHISDNHRLNPILRILDILMACMPAIAVYSAMTQSLQVGIAICTTIFILYVVYTIARFIIPLYIKSADMLVQTSHSAMGQIYIVWPMSLMLVAYIINPPIVLLMFIMIWINDTGAFCVGSLFGRHRLFERISPKKSWEGFWGGLLFSVAAGIITYYLPLNTTKIGYDIWSLVIFGIIVSVMATWGDLVESQIKRILGIKDSGHLLPGHGGILDRIDSLLLVAPSTLIFLLIRSII